MTIRNRSANIGGALINSTSIVLSTGTDLTTQANSASEQANAAYAQANAAYNAANNAQVTVYQNSASSITTQKINFVNTATITVAVSPDGSNANIALTAVGGAAYDQANAAYAQANAAYNEANLKLNISGGTITGSLNVAGNLIITGNTTTVNTESLVVNDPILLLANNNTTDIVDIGFIGHYGATQKHAGLVRHYSDNKFYLFTNYNEHILSHNNIIDIANVELATLKANIEANTLTVLNGVSGNVNFDSGTLFVNAVGNSVGIGTTTTIRTLTVAGGFAFAEPNGSARGLHWGDSITGHVPVYIGGDATSSNTGIKFYVSPFGVASGAERMRITANGEVGIGTAIPSHRLGVSASAANTRVISLYNPNATGSYTAIGSQYDADNSFSGSEVRFINENISTGTSALAFATGTNSQTERMRITSGGNVGIGTTSTPWRFNVTGAVRSIQIRQSNTNNADKYSFMSAGHYTSDTYTDGFTLIGGIGSSGTNQVSIGGSVNEALAASLIAFYTAANNTTVTGSERMRINSSGDVSIGSAVNAGDTLRYLDVYNTNTGSSAGAITRLITANAAGTGVTTLDIVKYKTGGAIINNNEPSSSGFIGFNVSGGERMRITSGGNVGINVTSPAYAGLHLNTPSGDSILHITRAAQGTGATDGFSIGLGNDGNGYVFLREAAVLVFGTSNAERGRFSASGGFSLGTTADPGGGAIFATGEITAFYSDDRLKTKLGNIDNALGKVLSLNGFLYEPNETAIELGYEKKVNVGVSAQEVNAILPEAVVAAPIDDKYMTVHYHKLVPLLIEAIKDLNAKVEQMQKVIDEKK